MTTTLNPPNTTQEKEFRSANLRYYSDFPLGEFVTVGYLLWIPEDNQLVFWRTQTTDYLKKHFHDSCLENMMGWLENCEGLMESIKHEPTSDFEDIKEQVLKNVCYHPFFWEETRSGRISSIEALMRYYEHAILKRNHIEGEASNQQRLKHWSQEFMQEMIDEACKNRKDATTEEQRMFYAGKITALVHAKAHGVEFPNGDDIILDTDAETKKFMQSSRSFLEALNSIHRSNRRCRVERDSDDTVRVYFGKDIWNPGEIGHSYEWIPEFEGTMEEFIQKYTEQDIKI